MMKHLSILMVITLVVGCSQPQATTESHGAKLPETSRFLNIDLKIGMDREKVEKQVAALLQQQNKYSPYGNSLRGGTVHYHDGDWVLEVKYKAGAPAPRFINRDGANQGLPPVDETILDYSIERIPNKKMQANDASAP
jgi:hypothetical protein